MEALGNFLAVCGPSPGLLFCYTEGRPLTHHLLSSSVQSILHLVGLSGSYSRHSFRIAAARTAASRGLPEHLIKTLGWWFSYAYQCYFRTSAGSLIQVSGQLAWYVQYGVCGLFCYWGSVPQVCSPGGCGLLATSPHHSGLGQPGGPLARWVGLVAGLQVGQAFGVFLLLGLGVGSSSPQVPWHPTSMSNSGIKYWCNLWKTYIIAAL